MRGPGLRASFERESLAHSDADRLVFLRREPATEANEIPKDLTALGDALETIIIYDSSQDHRARQCRLREADTTVGFGVENQKLSSSISPALPLRLVARAASSGITGSSKFTPIRHHLVRQYSSGPLARLREDVFGDGPEGETAEYEGNFKGMGGAQEP